MVKQAPTLSLVEHIDTLSDKGRARYIASLNDKQVLRLGDDLLQEEKQQCEASLSAFVEKAWHVIEPSTSYVSNWHIDAVIEHLEAVTLGEIRNLLINMPPRHTKSLTVAVFWPSWEWASAPEIRWLFSSYVEKLAIRDCVKSRRLIQSPWYKGRWGDIFALTSDQNEKTRYENDKTGYRIATSVEGAGTGEGGDRIVCDDPHNVKEGESEAKRESTLIWWDEVMSTRGNDPATSARVIVMQRIHEHDLSGHVLGQGGYEYLCLPAEYEKKVYVTSIGFHDPRKEDGELLCPARFSREVINEMKLRLGPYGTAGQLQQRPAPRGGGMFKRVWFTIVDSVPGRAKRCRYWDKAGTEGGGKYTAGVLLARADKITYIEDVVRGQWSAAVREQTIKQTTELDADKYTSHGVAIWVEQEPGSGGKESAEATIKNLMGYRIRAHRPTGDKFERADPLAGAAEAGNVKLVRGSWNEAFLQEMEMAGPGAAYLDQMDAAAGAFNKLTSASVDVSVGPIGAMQASQWRIE